jgi:hypothetical protein
MGQGRPKIGGPKTGASGAGGRKRDPATAAAKRNDRVAPTSCGWWRQEAWLQPAPRTRRLDGARDFFRGARLPKGQILADPVGQTDGASRADVRYEDTGGTNHQQN